MARGDGMGDKMTADVVVQGMQWCATHLAQLVLYKMVAQSGDAWNEASSTACME